MHLTGLSGAFFECHTRVAGFVRSEVEGHEAARQVTLAVGRLPCNQNVNEINGAKLNAIALHYSYRKSDEPYLKPLLSSLEEKAGGVRRPYDGRKGVLDLATILEVIVSFTAAVAAQSILEKYFEGLFRGEAFKNLGESQRRQIESWLSKVKLDISKTIRVVQPLISSQLATTRFGEKGAVALVIYLGKRQLNVVLNHSACSADLLQNLPDGIIRAIRYSTEKTLPEDAHELQLYFDKDTSEWKYLLAPSPEGIGRWIDRYIDLESGQVKTIKSRQEFHEIFRPESSDEYKFLVSPFI